MTPTLVQSVKDFDASGLPSLTVGADIAVGDVILFAVLGTTTQPASATLDGLPFTLLDAGTDGDTFYTYGLFQRVADGSDAAFESVIYAESDGAAMFALQVWRDVGEAAPTLVEVQTGGDTGGALSSPQDIVTDGLTSTGDMILSMFFADFVGTGVITIGSVTGPTDIGTDQATVGGVDRMGGRAVYDDSPSALNPLTSNISSATDPRNVFFGWAEWGIAWTIAEADVWTVLSTVATLDHDVIIGQHPDDHHNEDHALDETVHIDGFIYREGFKYNPYDEDSVPLVISDDDFEVPEDGQVGVTYELDTEIRLFWIRSEGVWRAVEV